MKKIVKISLIFLVSLFFIAFVNRNNYYDGRVVLTNEQIKEFESDLKSGKKVNISKYHNNDRVYSNKITIVFTKISKSLEYIVDKSLRKVFNYLGS